MLVKGKTVLIVDKDIEATRQISKNLESRGNLVFTASRGGMAMTIAKKINPSVVLLDLSTPDTDGLNICQKLRSTSANGALPIILLVRQNTTLEKRYTEQYGIVDVLRKPIVINDLFSKVSKAISGGYDVPPLMAAPSPKAEESAPAPADDLLPSGEEPAQPGSELFESVAMEASGPEDTDYSEDSQPIPSWPEAEPEGQVFTETSKSGLSRPPAENFDPSFTSSPSAGLNDYEEDIYSTPPDLDTYGYQESGPGTYGGSDIMRDNLKHRLKNSSRGGETKKYIYIALGSLLFIVVVAAGYLLISKLTGEGKTPPEKTAQPMPSVRPTIPVRPGNQNSEAPDTIVPETTRPVTPPAQVPDEDLKPPPVIAPPEIKKPEQKPATAVKPPKIKITPESKPSYVSASFSVQIGAFTDRANADKLVKTLRAKNYDVFIKRVFKGGKTTYKVMVGKFRDKDTASRVASELKIKHNVADTYIVAD